MITVNQIAEILDGEVVGDGTQVISGVAKVEDAKPGMLAFIANPKYEKYAGSTSASCVLVSRTFDQSKFSKLPPALIKLDDPYSSFVIAIEKFAPKKNDIPKGIDATAVIHSSAIVGNDCSVGAYVVVGANVIIGENTVIHPHVVIGRDVTIGTDCLFYAHVTVREECKIGNRVILQPGVVIGGDGFGFAPKKDRTYQKIPQLGIVVIEDDVEIQANSCIDRATLGDTRVKRGAKLDDFVQVAHNSVIGEDTVIAGGTGIAGTTKVGNRNMIGGHVAITGHVLTVDDVKIGGGSIVSRILDHAGSTYTGYPAKEVTKWRKIEAASRQLPELLVTIREMQAKIKELEEEITKLKSDDTE
jgi:UDP-3-O-[3-hydroxymyristoyl] glucosamine N-acyltransferase